MKSSNVTALKCATCLNGITRKVSVPSGGCRKSASAAAARSSASRQRWEAVAILAIIAALSFPAAAAAAAYAAVTQPRDGIFFIKANLARSLQEGDGHILHDHEHEHKHHHEATSLVLEGGHEGEDNPKPWFYTILATVLVDFTSLSGLVLLLVPAIHRGYLKMKSSYNDQDIEPKNKRWFDICVPSFAVGALMSTAAFLVFPEALHLIEGAHPDEGQRDRLRFLASDEHVGHDDSSERINAAKFGCAVLGGFLLPIALGMLFPHHQHCSAADVADEVVTEGRKAETCPNEKDGKASVVTGNDEGCDCCGDDEDDDVETGVAVREIVQVEGDMPQAQFAEDSQGSSKSLTQTTSVNWHLVASVLVGDAFCNFVDGIFIGAAFLSCSWGTVFSIILVTLLHEIPQEVADFLILTRYAGLSATMACFVNFTSGLSVTLGGIVVLATTPSQAATGITLAVAGGAYINISVAETVPRIDKNINGKVDRLLMLTFFVVGCVPIGLVLLKHEHC